MISYTSTRGDNKKNTFSEAILKGMAPDGGLFVPNKLPRFSLNELRKLSKKSYQERAVFIFNLFETNFSDDVIKKIVAQAYASQFDIQNITPVVHLKDNQYILELWHGPTAAFKDIALQIMPLFFLEAIKKEKSNFRYLILAATSGDTGKAALEGYKDKENISAIVFYPNGKVSQLQQLQMQTQEGRNVSVYALLGGFDKVQTLVKDIFQDTAFNKKLLKKGIILSSANSINWGRLIPQIVYHVSSYIDLVNQKVITFGDAIDVVVPSGNFGNLLAAFYAKKMGLPIRKFVCASNKNNVLTGFFQTGTYDITNRSLSKTPSPSMDILIASNIERLLFLITNDAKQVSLWMRELRTKKKFSVDSATKKILQEEFSADWVSNKECLQNIKRIYDDTHYLMDPHTSIAQIVAERYSKREKVSIPVVISATAHFSKFAKDISHALQIAGNVRDEFVMLQEIEKFAPEVSIPKSISSLKNKKIRFKEKCDVHKSVVEDKILQFFGFS